MEFNCEDGRCAFSANWIASGWRFREYKISSLVDISFSVNSVIYSHHLSRGEGGNLSVGGDKVEISPGGEDLFDATVYSS